VELGIVGDHGTAILYRGFEKALVGAAGDFNSDQGSQFTSEKFTVVLKGGTTASAWMGAGDVWTHFHRTVVAFAEIRRGVLADYRLVPEARAGISRYFQFYNYDGASELGVPNAGGSLPGPECLATTGQVGRRSWSNSELCRKPPEFTAFGPEWLFWLLLAKRHLSGGCGSAGKHPSAEWRASAAPDSNQTRRSITLLGPRMG